MLKFLGKSLMGEKWGKYTGGREFSQWSVLRSVEDHRPARMTVVRFHAQTRYQKKRVDGTVGSLSRKSRSSMACLSFTPLFYLRAQNLFAFDIR